jgi:integrase
MAPEYARTPATANRYMAALSSVFSQVCGDWEWLQPNQNPFTGFGKLPEGKAKGQAYADAARVKLLQAAAEDPQLHRLIRVALGTAARASELLDLTWAHVEFIPATMNATNPGTREQPEHGRLMFVDTKNGETRVAWLFGDALAAMQEQREERLGAGPRVTPGPASLSLPVFPGMWSHKRKRYGRYDYLPRLHAALERAGLKMSRPFHALRHTAATTAARMGANAHQLKAMGGWKSDAVNTYVHIAGQDTKDLAQQLAKRLAHGVQK